jgi:hypothetical protein
MNYSNRQMMTYVRITVNPAPSQPGPKSARPQIGQPGPKPILFLVNPAPFFFIIYFALKCKHLSRNKIKINNKNKSSMMISFIIYFI